MSYRICTKCIMDITDPDISFDIYGVCNHCRDYYKQGHIFFATSEEKEKELERMVDNIKARGKNKPYDCVIGLSGGVDSTFVAYKVTELGLRPLAFHLDNGWNSELAVKNIENTVNKLNIDFYTHVIDWEEFKDLQKSFLKASVVDIELLTDHALKAVLFKGAVKNNINYIVWGTNYATESIMPKSWSHHKIDFKNIKSIHNTFGSKRLKTFPRLSMYRWLYYSIFKVKSVSLLDYLEYNKQEAIDLLKEALCWKEYQYKHDESVFTKFYQDYILPKKFNIDKRRAHYSSMINSGQISRAEALRLIGLEDPMSSKNTIETKDYFLKKMDMDNEALESLLAKPALKHTDYPSNTAMYSYISRIGRVIKSRLHSL